MCPRAFLKVLSIVMPHANKVINSWGAFGNALLLHREYHGSELNNDNQLQAV